MDTPKIPPSLLSLEATGGENNERGLTFQEIALLSLVPFWLSREGFTSLIREHFGDAEAKFFVPGIGFVKEFVEAKNHPLAPTEFWHEIGEFQRRADTSASYRWFRLVSTGLSAELRPLRNGLRRVRDPYSFYKEDAVIAQQAYADFEKVVLGLGKDAKTARFLYEQVLIEDDHSTNLSYGPSLFAINASRFLSSYDDLTGKAQTAAYQSISALIGGRLNQEVTRRDIENAYHGVLPEGQRPARKPIHIHTATSVGGSPADTALPFDWDRFFGGGTREYPPTESWDTGVTKVLQEARSWASEYRAERRIRLTGQRRLSANVAIGAAFSAVSGFNVDEVYRDGVLWRTDDHPGPDTPAYEVAKAVDGSETGPALVVSVGILGGIATDVQAAMAALGLAGLPELHLTGASAIVSPQQANLAARIIKDAIRDRLRDIGGTDLHLFCKVPSPLALFIGHRINATNAGEIHCYEWTGPGRYARTCTIGKA